MCSSIKHLILVNISQIDKKGQYQSCTSLVAKGDRRSLNQNGLTDILPTPYPYIFLLFPTISLELSSQKNLKSQSLSPPSVGGFIQVQVEEEEESRSRGRKPSLFVKVKMSGVESSNSWSKCGNFADYMNELHSLMSRSRLQASLSSLHSVQVALVPILNWVQFYSLGGVKSSKSRTVAEPFERGILCHLWSASSGICCVCSRYHLAGRSELGTHLTIR